MAVNRPRFAGQPPPELTLHDSNTKDVISPTSNSGRHAPGNLSSPSGSVSQNGAEDEDKLMGGLDSDLSRRASRRRTILQERMKQEDEKFSERHWMPWALNFWVMIVAAVVIAIIGIVLEVLRAVNHKCVPIHI